MRQIKVKFVDFWSEFNVNDNFIVQRLKNYYEIIISEQPDYLFYSVFSHEHLKYNCVKIFYTGENICPDFNLCDYAIGFERMEYGDRYFRAPLYMLIPFAREKYEKALRKHENNENIIESKREFCSFVYSNKNSDPFRERLYDKLSTYKNVQSGGRYLNNIGGYVDNKYQFQLSHKFDIACENSSHSGYITEKIIDAYAAKTIPIYWGDPTIATEFNSKSFINCNDYDSFDKIVEVVRKIDTDDREYLRMINEPITNKPVSLQKFDDMYDTFLRNIFDQKQSDAYRRNRVYWGKMYCDEMSRKFVKGKNIQQDFEKIKNIIKNYRK